MVQEHQILGYDEDLLYERRQAEHASLFGRRRRFLEAARTKKLRTSLAKQSHVPQTTPKYRKAKSNESNLAEALRGSTSNNQNEPFDIYAGRHAIEVKTIDKSGYDRITMHVESLKSKLKAAKKGGYIPHTVVFDTRKGQEAVYYRKGLGSFRLNQMQKMESIDGVREALGIEAATRIGAEHILNASDIDDKLGTPRKTYPGVVEGKKKTKEHGVYGQKWGSRHVANRDPHVQKYADKLGLEYRGEQDVGDKAKTHIFQDPRTGSSFASDANSQQELEKDQINHRRAWGRQDDDVLDVMDKYAKHDKESKEGGPGSGPREGQKISVGNRNGRILKLHSDGTATVRTKDMDLRVSHSQLGPPKKRGPLLPNFADKTSAVPDSRGKFSKRESDRPKNPARFSLPDSSKRAEPFAFEESGVKGQKWGVRHKPSVTVMMGTNGSGKSTVMKALADRYKSTEENVKGNKWSVVHHNGDKALILGNYQSEDHVNASKYFEKGNFWGKLKDAVSGAKDIGAKTVVVDSKRLGFGKAHDDLVKWCSKNGVQLQAVRVRAPIDTLMQRIRERKEAGHQTDRSEKQVRWQHQQVKDAYSKLKGNPRLRLNNGDDSNPVALAGKLGNFIFEGRSAKEATFREAFGNLSMKGAGPVRHVKISSLRPTEALGPKKHEVSDSEKKRAKKGKQRPILIRRHKGHYDILDGHHRYLAARSAGNGRIPARIRK